MGGMSFVMVSIQAMYRPEGVTPFLGIGRVLRKNEINTIKNKIPLLQKEKFASQNLKE